MTSNTFFSDSGTASNCVPGIASVSRSNSKVESTHHLIPPSAMHESILIHDNPQPQIRHLLHPLPLRKRAQELQKDLAQQRRRSQSRLSHPLRIAAEHLRLEQFLEHREEDLFEDDGEVDVVVAEDFGGEERSLQTADGDLSEFAGWIEAELGVGGEKRNPSGFPGCRRIYQCLFSLHDTVSRDSPKNVESEEEAIRSGIAA